MVHDLKWADMHVDERFAVGADWAPALDGASLVSVAVEVLEGNIDLNVSPPAGFQEIDGTVQNVWRSGGQAGVCRVRVTADTSDGRKLKEVYAFRVK